MDGRDTQEPGSRERMRDDATAADAVRDGDIAATAGDFSNLSSRLASELFARLLLELPEHRRELQSGGRAGDPERLARATHKLLGAVVYCDLPELADALRELKRTAESADTAQTGTALDTVLGLIDDLLADSGYRER